MRPGRWARGLALIALPFAGATGRLAAQTCSAPVPAGNCTANTTTSMTAGTLLQLTLSATSTPLTAPASADYDAGFVANAGPQTTIKCNRSWTLSVSAAAANWSASNNTPGVNARVNKPASDLQWSKAAGGPYVGLSVSAATAASGGATGGTTTSFFFHTLYAWNLDTPGAYSLPLVFTLSAP